MKTSICVLNLSPAHLDDTLEIHPATFVSVPDALRSGRVCTIQHLRDIPHGMRASAPPLILYILGHGVPNGVRSRGETISEAELADAIIERRGSAPTLIVWDICFAKSLMDVARLRTPASMKKRGPTCDWPPTYVHIFSCEAHERTWQMGNGKRSPALTVFSKDLQAALGELVSASGFSSWRKLEKRLQDRLAPLQKPFIHPKDGIQPATFNVGIARPKKTAAKYQHPAPTSA